MQTPNAVLSCSGCGREISGKGVFDDGEICNVCLNHLSFCCEPCEHGLSDWGDL